MIPLRSASLATLVIGATLAITDVAAADEPPNLLVIVIDALRADHLSSYGYPHPTSPKLDAFAARGARFTRAMAASNRTGTSMSSMWTGLLPSRHGVFRKRDVLDARFTTAAELLRERGYRTGAWCPNPSLDSSFGHAQGWQTYDDDILIGDQAGDLRPWQRWETAAAINERALRWIDQAPGPPFLAWLHYRDVHGPYIPPPPYDAMFSRREKRPLTEEEIAARQGYLTLPDDGNDLFHYVAQYDGEVRYADERVSELIAALERRGLLERTVVLVTADHGEAFLDHGQWNHDSSLYEEEVHVPLIIIRPGAGPQVIERPVSAIDVFATLLDLADAPLTKSDSESLLPLLEGREGAYARQLAFAESNARGNAIQRAVRDGNWKLIVHDSIFNWLFGTPTELYDLVSDPKERRNLAAAQPERASRMSVAIEAAVGNEPTVLAMPRSAIDDTLERRLQALGYVN